MSSGLRPGAFSCTSAGRHNRAFFNASPIEGHTDEPALFDSRVFTIPDPTEVYNYFVWRQNDASRNSIQMAAQACFSQKELQGKTCDELQELLWRERGINWNDYAADFTRGRFIERKTCTQAVTYTHKETGELLTAEGAVRAASGRACRSRSSPASRPGCRAGSRGMSEV